MSSDSRYDDEYNYRYYLLGNSMPIRVLFSKKDGLRAGAQVPDRSAGRLVFKHAYMRKVEESWEIDEISQKEFARYCTAFYEK